MKPKQLHLSKVKDIFSEFKYKEVYENEKGIFFYPYFLTPQYETQVKAGKLQSQVFTSLSFILNTMQMSTVQFENKQKR